ncbi:MAG: tRNA-(ms[2]io[6]A)-hydroxylase [Flavobacteriales bacterium]
MSKIKYTEEELKDPINILGLRMSTDPRWVNIQEKNIDFILNDHAFCEQKAASACISLIIRFWDKDELVDQVTPVVAEEWMHFRMVLREMRKRNIPLKQPQNDGYVEKIRKFCRNGATLDIKLLDSLLTCALIEARSCERFRLLSLYCVDPELKTFYHDFMVSEAAHYTMFIKLAEIYSPKEQVRARWDEFLDYEAQFLSNYNGEIGKMH